MSGTVKQDLLPPLAACSATRQCILCAHWCSICVLSLCSCARSELLTEVVKDTEVMPADPSENLPLAQLHVPLLLNGRPTAPTTAAAAAAASLARRRQQQQAAAAAAAAAQQQQQLLAAAAAAHAAAARQEEYKQDMADLTGGEQCGLRGCWSYPTITI